MKKWTKQLTLYSVAVLASLSTVTAFAEEGTPATEDVPVVAIVPPTESSTEMTLPSDETTVPTVQVVPTDPSNNEVVVPTTPDATVPTEPTTTIPTGPTEVTQPSTDTNNPGTTEPGLTEPTEPPKTEPVVNEDGTSMVTVPTVDGGTTNLVPDVSVPTNNPSVSAQVAAEAGASQIGTTSTVTGQVVSSVSPVAPVYTDTGYQIISTQNSRVVVAYSDGSTATVHPSAVGGVVNADKTITVRDQAGNMKTLPNTGEKDLGLMAIAGTGLLASLAVYLVKKRAQEV